MEIDDENALAAMMLAESIKYGMIIVASVPVLLLYPFVQKHYVRGVIDRGDQGLIRAIDGCSEVDCHRLDVSPSDKAGASFRRPQIGLSILQAEIGDYV